MFRNYKDTIITNLILSDVEKMYPGIELAKFNILSSMEGETDLKIEKFRNLLDEIPQLNLRFAHKNLTLEEKERKDFAPFVMIVRSDGHIVQIDRLEEIVDDGHEAISGESGAKFDDKVYLE